MSKEVSRNGRNYVEKKVDMRMCVQFALECTFLMFYWIYALVKSVVKAFVDPERKSIAGETVLITGGANGIGKELSRQMALEEKNLKLVLWDIDTVSLKKVVKELKEIGVKDVYGYEVDVSDREAIRKAAEQVRQEVGEISILVNNAGIAGPMGEAWNLDLDKVDKVFRVNLICHAWILREFLPNMLKSNHGHVLEICSAAAFVYGPSASSYAATKLGLKGYIETVKEDIRRKYKDSKVMVTLAFPCFANTALVTGNELKARKYPFLLQMMTPEYLASKLLDGILKNKEYIYEPRFFVWLCSWGIPLLPMDFARKILDLVEFDSKMSVENEKE